MHRGDIEAELNAEADRIAKARGVPFYEAYAAAYRSRPDLATAYATADPAPEPVAKAAPRPVTLGEHLDAWHNRLVADWQKKGDDFTTAVNKAISDAEWREAYRYARYPEAHDRPAAAGIAAILEHQPIEKQRVVRVTLAKAL